MTEGKRKGKGGISHCLIQLLLRHSLHTFYPPHPTTQIRGEQQGFLLSPCEAHSGLKTMGGMYRPLEGMRQGIRNFEKMKPDLLGAETDTQAPKVYEIYVVDLEQGR